MTHHHTQTQLRYAQAECLICCLRRRGIEIHIYRGSVSMRVKAWDSLPAELKQSVACQETYIVQILEIELGEIRQMKWKRPNRKGNL